jgi:hypothetical protein
MGGGGKDGSRGGGRAGREGPLVRWRFTGSRWLTNQ